jgi:hypothetical protein
MKKSSKKSSKKDRKRKRKEEEDEDEDEEEDDECTWMEKPHTCEFPLGESENMPSSCNPRCPARQHMKMIVAQRAIDNRRMYQ